MTLSLHCVMMLCHWTKCYDVCYDVLFDCVIMMCVMLCCLDVYFGNVIVTCCLTVSLCRYSVSSWRDVWQHRCYASSDNVVMPGYCGGTGRTVPGLPFAVGGEIRICTFISPIGVARDRVSTHTQAVRCSLSLQRKSIPSFCQAGSATSLLHCCVPLIKVTPLQQVTRNHENT